MKLRYVKHYLERIRVEGPLNTFWYLFGSIFLPKLGIRVKYIFEFLNSHTAYDLPSGERASRIHEMNDLSRQDITLLEEYEGRPLIRQFESKFEAGNICVISRKQDGTLCSVVWAKPTPPDLLSCGNEAAYHIFDAFTLPHARGQGFFPSAIVKICNILKSSSTSPPPRIFCNIAFSNRASIRAVEKVSFRRVGYTVTAFGRTWRSLQQ